MSQVEGGDLLVIQRGKEASPRRDSDVTGSHNTSTTAGWHDGPWWRITSRENPRSISAVRGAVEATKLARASAESYATEYYSSRGGVEGAAKQATEVLSDSNPVRSSDIFLAIQAISQRTPADLFQAGPTTTIEKEKEKSEHPEIVDTEEEDRDEVSFAIYIHDPIHGIAFHTISQAVPQKWIDWLDAPAPEPPLPPPQQQQKQPSSKDNDNDNEDEEEDEEEPYHDEEYYSTVPEAIAEIIEAGGVDPREWVADWIEEAITLGVGVVAQRYVARRMGVGEGGVGKGKGKMNVEKASMVESGAGEAARAI